MADLVQPAPPEISAAEAERIAAQAFGVRSSATALGSHQDRNFLLVSGGERLLLKISNPGTPAAELEAQSAAAARLGAVPGLRAPSARAVGEGRTVCEIGHAGLTMNARLLEFVDGQTLSGSGYLSPAVVGAIGRLAARVDVALEGFTAAGVERENQWDLRRTPQVLAELLPYVGDEALRARAAEIAEEAWALVEAQAPELPVQAVHGDLTDDNVVTSDAITRIPDGVIDLGDLNRTWTVSELAVTVSSLLHHDGVDLPAALRAVTAYHAVRPLREAEARALWPLVALRAVVLVASAHHVLATDPENAYAAGNLEHERFILEAATSVPLPVATNLVLAATGHPTDVLALPPHGPLTTSVPAESVHRPDLSATSPDLHEGRWLDPGTEERLLRATGAALTLTRFAEPRLTRSATHTPAEPANVALGVQAFFAAPADLLAPWPGGLSVVPGGLRLTGEGTVLDLLGARATVEDGADVVAGQTIGRTDSMLEVRVLAEGASAPRFAPVSLAEAWRAVVADPSSLFPGEVSPVPRTSADDLLARREAVLAEVQEHYYEQPPVIVRGWREHLVDADGRVYLDLINNVTSIGHAHPRLVEAVTRQWQLINTNSRFSYPAIVEYAERLAGLLPAPLDTVFLVNSGSEAVDLALRLARAATGRRDVLAVREAYHGWTDLSDAVSTSVADNPDALATRPDWVHTVDAPNPYRGTHRGEDAGRYAPEAVAQIEALAAAGTPPGAFIAEAYYGNAGGIPLPDGYLAEVYAAVRRHGGLVVADEVQVGFGRLGEWFWGFEQQQVVPDIVTVAKAIGNGHPLGAVVTTRAVAEAYRTQGYFFSSAGGSPVSSVVGLTVLDILRDEGLPENARVTGAYLKDRLLALGDKHPLVGTVHGSGFYLGLEFVRGKEGDRASLTPATAETAAICERLRELGVIVQPTGDHQNVLKIKPPMCLDRRSADAFADAVDHVLTHGW